MLHCRFILIHEFDFSVFIVELYIKINICAKYEFNGFLTNENNIGTSKFLLCKFSPLQMQAQQHYVNFGEKWISLCLNRLFFYVYLHMITLCTCCHATYIMCYNA